MPALNVEFTEDEMEQLRQAAETEGASVKKLAHDSILAGVHRRRVMEAAARVTRVSSGLNKKLAR